MSEQAETGKISSEGPDGSASWSIDKRPSRSFLIGSATIGGDHAILIQSMCATKTQDIPATLAQIRLLEAAGADLIRVAVDSRKDVAALEQMSQETESNLVVDLQESYRLAADVAPFVSKFRYNPGHLHHHQKKLDVKDKVAFLVDQAGAHNCAIRIGVNFGSLDPSLKSEDTDSAEVALRSATEHCEMLERLGFKRYVVSLKSSDPTAVVAINKRFAAQLPDVPLHLGVTEAGLLPDGAIKTRIAFEQLLHQGIGDTVRVSLTLPDAKKDQEIFVARKIVEDIREGRFRSVPEFFGEGMNIISCPSCSRVENGKFVELAEKVKAATESAAEKSLTIAVMGCRVNGPGETDDADFGLWCAPNFVNLKKGTETLGQFSYEEVIPRLLEEIEAYSKNI